MLLAKVKIGKIDYLRETDQIRLLSDLGGSKTLESYFNRVDFIKFYKAKTEEPELPIFISDFKNYNTGNVEPDIVPDVRPGDLFIPDADPAFNYSEKLFKDKIYWSSFISIENRDKYIDFLIDPANKEFDKKSKYIVVWMFESYQKMEAISKEFSTNDKQFAMIFNVLNNNEEIILSIPVSQIKRKKPQISNKEIEFLLTPRIGFFDKEKKILSVVNSWRQPKPIIDKKGNVRFQ